MQKDRSKRNTVVKNVSKLRTGQLKKNLEVGGKTSAGRILPKTESNKRK